MNALVELHGVSKRYGSAPALHSTDLSFERGKTTVLIGPSGCGKSTMLRLIIRLLEADSGEIKIDGKNVSPANITALRHRVGYVIQDGGLFPHLTARGNVLLLARHLNKPAPLEKLCGLTRFPTDALDRYPAELSGGQRQRVGLMRALALSPELLLLDEPLGALDPLVRAALQKDLKEIFQRAQANRHSGHARPGGGCVSGRPDRLDERRPRRATRHAGRLARKSRERIRDRFHQRAAQRRPDMNYRRDRRGRREIFLLSAISAFSAVTFASAASPVIVGSKKFTESYVLAEIAKHSLGNAGFKAEHRQGMGGTIILWEALRTGQIAAYPEYTGTIAEEILKNPDATSMETLRTELAKSGVGMTPELGFNNTYALVMRRDAAARLNIRTISDLRAHPELTFGLTHEFLDRRDGWQPLAARYGLQSQNLKGIDHGLGYEALRTGAIEVKDAYSTDARIAENDLVALEDDLHFFPQYQAVYLYRLSLDQSAVAGLNAIAGTLDEARMIKLNAEAEQSKDYARAADLYFGTQHEKDSLTQKIMRWTVRHLELAGVSLLLSILVGVPLGIAASKPGPVSHIILGLTSAIQTIPSLALLALLVPLPFFGISVRTAIARFVPLRLASDRAQHRDRVAGHRALHSRIRHRAWPNEWCTAAPNLSADRLPHHPRRN